MTGRRVLPHEADRKYLTWTGFETDLIFKQGVELPGFASFPLLERSDTRAMLLDYAKKQIALAHAAGFGTVIESATWVANQDRAAPLGYDAARLARVNADAIALLSEARAGRANVLISGNIGPRADAYAPGKSMAAKEAEAYHSRQIDSLVGTDLDLVTAYTLSDSNEAIGIARAARRAGLRVVMAFTVELDGCLPGGQAVDAAIAQVDAATDGAVAYFMVNCAHPDHFSRALTQNPRLGGVVVNASRCAHAELDEATELDEGDADELGGQVAEILAKNPKVRVFGGCCGTGFNHLGAMVRNVGEQA